MQMVCDAYFRLAIDRMFLITLSWYACRDHCTPDCLALSTTFPEGYANLPTVSRTTAWVYACETWPLHVMQSTKIFTFNTIQYIVDFDNEFIRFIIYFK